MRQQDTFDSSTVFSINLSLATNCWTGKRMKKSTFYPQSNVTGTIQSWNHICMLVRSFLICLIHFFYKMSTLGKARWKEEHRFFFVFVSRTWSPMAIYRSPASLVENNQMPKNEGLHKVLVEWVPRDFFSLGGSNHLWFSSSKLRLPWQLIF